MVLSRKDWLWGRIDNLFRAAIAVRGTDPDLLLEYTEEIAQRLEELSGLETDKKQWEVLGE